MNESTYDKNFIEVTPDNIAVNFIMSVFFFYSTPKSPVRANWLNFQNIVLKNSWVVHFSGAFALKANHPWLSFVSNLVEFLLDQYAPTVFTVVHISGEAK